MIKSNVKKYDKDFIKNVIIAFLAPVLTFYLSESLTHNPFTTMGRYAHLLNMALFEIIMMLLFSLCGRLRWALMAETSFFMILGIINYFLLEFRSSPLMPWDILSITTAANVANNFNYKMSAKAILLIGSLLVLLVAEFCLAEKKRILNWKIRLAGVGTMFLCLAGFLSVIQNESLIKLFVLNNIRFDPRTMSYNDGTSVAFLMNLEYAFVEKPKGYNAAEVQEILKSYENTEPEQAGEEMLPNIIVIMNEAFCDPAVLGDFKTNKDYMPFLHSLMENGENTKSGYLHVSVLGGNTANTEFEFLTGNSMAFLPQGSVPFQQYIKREVPSIASYLKSYGYSTIGMHPASANGWERERVYPLLGLDAGYFSSDFENPEKIRRYVSDKANYDKIIELFEAKESGKPLFLFNVTIQNHSSYAISYDDFSQEISASDISSDELDQYLSLIYLSDEALEYILSYFEQIEEPTIIVFFGDHQPADSVVSSIWELNGKNRDTLTNEEVAERYKVPYVIWTNYESETIRDEDISVNFLASKVLETAGIPQSGYMTFLSELSEKYPVVSPVSVISADKEFFSLEEKKDDFLIYQRMQYYSLFDYKK